MSRFPERSGRAEIPGASDLRLSALADSLAVWVFGESPAAEEGAHGLLAVARVLQARRSGSRATVATEVSALRQLADREQTAEPSRVLAELVTAVVDLEEGRIAEARATTHRIAVKTSAGVAEPIVALARNIEDLCAAFMGELRTPQPAPVQIPPFLPELEPLPRVATALRSLRRGEEVRSELLSAPVSGPLAAIAVHVRAQNLLYYGEPAEVIDELSGHAERPDSPGAELRRTVVDYALAEAYLMRGHVAEAAHVLERSRPAPILDIARVRLLQIVGDDATVGAVIADRLHDATTWASVRQELTMLEALLHHRAGDALAAHDAYVRALHGVWAYGAVDAFRSLPWDVRECLRSRLAPLPRRTDDEVPRFLDSPFAQQWTRVVLSDREKRVLDQLAGGASIAEAAATLFVSVNTVKAQVQSLYRKLGTHSRDEALTVAAQRGLLG